MLEIEIRKAVSVPGIYACFLKFSTYNENWIAVIRSFHCRKYYKETREWEFPFYNLGDIISRYQNLEIKIHFKKEKLDEGVLQVPELNLKKELFNHQKIAVEYGINHPKYLLLDTMGLGKTASIIAEAIALKKLGKIRQCLIICCVSDLQYNWEKEIEKFSDESCYILGSRFRKNGKRYAGSVNDRIEDLKTHKEFFLITNAETLQKDKFVETVNNVYKKTPTTIDFLAIDECHKKCFSKGTKVFTSKGTKNIEDITLDDKILTYCPEYKKYPWQFRRPLNVFMNVNETRMIELSIQLSDGTVKTIKCTEDHEIYTKNRGYVKACDLTEEDDIEESPYKEKFCKRCGKELHMYKRNSVFCSRDCLEQYMHDSEEWKKNTSNWASERFKDDDYRNKMAKVFSERMKTNNPIYKHNVIEKIKETKLKHNFIGWVGERGGNGSMSPAEKVAYEILNPLGFEYNKAISVDKLRKEYPEENYPINYKPDFVYNKLCIEIDGETHKRISQKLLDKKKTKCLELMGYTVMRFSNDFVINHTQKFIEEIHKLWQNY